MGRAFSSYLKSNGGRSSKPTVVDVGVDYSAMLKNVVVAHPTLVPSKNGVPPGDARGHNPASQPKGKGKGASQDKSKTGKGKGKSKGKGKDPTKGKGKSKGSNASAAAGKEPSRKKK